MRQQGKYVDTLGAWWHDSFGAFSAAVSRYYRTRRVRLYSAFCRKIWLLLSARTFLKSSIALSFCPVFW